MQITGQESSVFLLSSLFTLYGRFCEQRSLCLAQIFNVEMVGVFLCSSSTPLLDLAIALYIKLAYIKLKLYNYTYLKK